MYTYSIPPCARQLIDMLMQELLSELYVLVTAECFIPKTKVVCTAVGHAQKVCEDLLYAQCSPCVLPSLLPQGWKKSLCGTDI